MPVPFKKYPPGNDEIPLTFALLIISIFAIYYILYILFYFFLV